MSAPFDPFRSGDRAAPVPGPTSSQGVFHSARGSGAPQLGPIGIAGPPAGLLAAAGLTALLGVVVGLIGRADWLSLVGWALSGPIAIGILAAFTLADTKRRSAPIYTSPGWVTAAYSAVVLIAVVGIVVGALGFAFWVGRQ